VTSTTGRCTCHSCRALRDEPHDLWCQVYEEEKGKKKQGREEDATAANGRFFTSDFMASALHYLVCSPSGRQRPRASGRSGIAHSS
jgi:hypothetical protein